MRGHFEVAENFPGGVREEIAARETFKKTFEWLSGGGGERAQVGHDFVVGIFRLRGMDALIEIAIQVVRGGDVKLPDIFGFPRSESFWVDGFDVRVGEEA